MKRKELEKRGGSRVETQVTGRCKEDRIDLRKEVCAKGRGDTKNQDENGGQERGKAPFANGRADMGRELTYGSEPEGAGEKETFGKNAYDRIEIPQELEETVRNAIDEAGRRRGRKKGAKRVWRILKGTAAAAASVLIVFAAGLNASQAFAESVSRVPGLGALAQVLTVRSYHESEGDYNIQAEVPGIVEKGAKNGETDGKENGAAAQPGIAGEANRQIEEIVDGYVAQAKEEFEAYKEAFFATGGTKEEWNDRQMEIFVDYNVKYQDESVLSLELITSKGWVSAQEERRYYNLDLASDRELSLEELLGSGYVEQCNSEVKRQIKERMAADENQIFFGFGEDDGMIEGFKTVDEDTQFYIDGDKQVVLVFPEYSIAPGYMGITEFKVGKAEGI